MKLSDLLLCSIFAVFVLIVSCGPSKQEQLRQEKWEREQRAKEAAKQEKERELRDWSMKNDCWTTWKEMTKPEKLEVINWTLTNVYHIKHQKARNEEIRDMLKADSAKIVHTMMFGMMKCGYIQSLNDYILYDYIK